MRAVEQWITRKPDESQQRVQQAIATTDALAFEQARLDREQRDLITAFRLELALNRFPACLI